MPLALLLSRPASQPRGGSNWVAVGKGALFRLPPTARRPMDPTDSEGVDLFGRSREAGFSLGWYRLVLNIVFAAMRAVSKRVSFTFCLPFTYLACRRGASAKRS
jgi:hypothetical protein